MLFVGALALYPAVALSKTAQAPGMWSSDTMPFDIPAQPIERALLAYGRIANVQVLYDASLVTAQRSTPISGRYTASQALEMLLRGTGLRVRYVSATRSEEHTS